MPISRDISIEELVERVPASVAFLRDKGITCIICGEPVWGTLYELALQKGFSESEIDELVSDIEKL